MKAPMTAEQYKALMVDLHRPAERQGPGGEEETKQAMRLAGIDPSSQLKLADIGCGTGASTMVLAGNSSAQITAVDFLPEFLEELQARAEALGLTDRITTLECSMEALPFRDQEFDVIWSEGAIYNVGFEAGIAAWKRFLKPGGKLVVSEITWLRANRPAELQEYWEREYPEIDLASGKLATLERNGYSPEAYFVLPARCWDDQYYRPMQSRFESFLERHKHSEQARAIVEAEKREIDLFQRYHEFYSYGVYVARA